MLGLLRKDLTVIFRRMKSIQLLVLFVPIIPLSQNPQFIPLAVGAFIAYLLSIHITSSFSYDVNSKWDLYTSSLPLSTHKIVGEKYLLVLMTIFLSLSAVSITLIIFNYFNISAYSPKLSIAITLIFSCLFNAIQLPIIYKFGVEASRITLPLAIMIPTLLFALLRMLNINISFEIIYTNVFIYFLLILLFVFFLISFSLSVFLYNKNKEK